MDVEKAVAFLREHHRGVLTTHRSDGAPQMSPVLCTADSEGRVLVSTRETALKTRNLLRDPRMAMCVFTDAYFGPWVQVEGTAEVISLPLAMDGLVDYYRRVAGEHDDWDGYRAAMEQERRVLVRMTIARAGPDASG